MKKIKNILLAAFLILNSLNLLAQTENVSSGIVKIGNLNIEISDYNKAIFKIDSIVTKFGGYIAEEKEAIFKAKVTNEIIIRVSTKHFSTLVYKITEISDKVNTKEIKAIKVDKAISDLNERLGSKEEVKARYLTLVEKSKLAIEISELERKIAAISVEIHSIKKEIGNYSESSTSTLNIYMKQQVVMQGQKNTAADLSKNAMTQLFKNILMYSLVPILLLLAYYFLVHKPIEKAKRKKRRSKSGKQSPW